MQKIIKWLLLPYLKSRNFQNQKQNCENNFLQHNDKISAIVLSTCSNLVCNNNKNHYFVGTGRTAHSKNTQYFSWHRWWHLNDYYDSWLRYWHPFILLYTYYWECHLYKALRYRQVTWSFSRMATLPKNKWNKFVKMYTLNLNLSSCENANSLQMKSYKSLVYSLFCFWLTWKQFQ